MSVKTTVFPVFRNEIFVTSYERELTHLSHACKCTLGLFIQIQLIYRHALMFQ